MSKNKKLNKCEVDISSIYKEMASNTIDDLEIMRESISNSVDAKATKIRIGKFIDQEFNMFSIFIKDDGDGMSLHEVKDFFDLGSSAKKSSLIGQKGLGTKTYFRCRRVEVLTQKDGQRHKAVLDNPWSKLQQNLELEYSIEESLYVEGDDGTTVTIIGYAVNHPEKVFDSEVLKDYILWRTAGGSFKNKFTFLPELRKRINNMTVSPVIILEDHINGTNEEFVGKHRFSLPNENPDYDDKGRQSHDYCKTFGPFHKETYIDGEYVSFQIYGTISGYNQRADITHFGQGEGHKSRFGVILCKDFMYIENTKYSMIDDDNYHSYHITVNSQNFELTSDRNNIRNKESAAVKWVLEEAKKLILKQICKVAKMTYFALVDEEDARLQTKKKVDELNKRLNNYSQKEDLPLEDFPIVKTPTDEAQVVAVMIAMISKGMISDFKIGEYSSQSATDIIAEKQDGSLELVEVEYCLSRLFNHGHPMDTFDSVACWDVDLPDNYSKLLDGKMLTVKKNIDNITLQYGVNKTIKVLDLQQIISDIKVS